MSEIFLVVSGTALALFSIGLHVLTNSSSTIIEEDGVREQLAKVLAGNRGDGAVQYAMGDSWPRGKFRPQWPPPKVSRSATVWNVVIAVMLSGQMMRSWTTWRSALKDWHEVVGRGRWCADEENRRSRKPIGRKH